MMPSTTRPALGGVFGGGGMFGIGYAMGVIRGLGESGVSFDGAPLLGTSAGSWAAAAVALRVDVQDLLALKVPSFPNARTGVLAAAARELFGEQTCPTVKRSEEHTSEL